MKFKYFLISAMLFAAATGSAWAAESKESTFQQTCSNIGFVYSGNLPAVQAVCLRNDGTPNNTLLVITGVTLFHGELLRSTGESDFQKRCGNIKIVVYQFVVSLVAYCPNDLGNSHTTSISLTGISNNNGNLTY